MDDVVAEVLPAQKLDVVWAEQATGRIAMMVGDGVNDAPALGGADVGVAIGAELNEVALGGADVALLGTELGRLPQLIGLADVTRRVISQNVWLAFGLAVLLIALAARGLLDPLTGALAQGLAVLAVVAKLRGEWVQDLCPRSLDVSGIAGHQCEPVMQCGRVQQAIHRGKRSLSRSASAGVESDSITTLAFANLRDNVRVEEVTSHRRTRLSFAGGRSKTASSPPCGISIRYSLNVVAPLPTAGSSASRRIRLCSSSNDTPWRAARRRSLATTDSSILRTTSWAIAGE